ncbi:DUF6498-containing protein [Halonotius roseus]|uniref:PH domain-containing protein n=1 Tax=Halonotius roseus TaxID=2511997 RepID=A0A544QSH7_9EURY|nr:DUF6498-containing protein [Halonotius roseus]TQQ82369.1 PH domain-containing protein [Halonotius roseus]
MEFSGVSARGLADHRQELFAVVVANAIPLTGVGLLGWDISALVVLYWVELAVIFVFAVIRALFAGRRSEFNEEGLIIGAVTNRRASLSIPRTALAVHLSSLPVVLIAIPVLTALWFVVGAVTVGVVGAETLDSSTLEMITVASFGILCTEGSQVAVGYLYRGEYREHSAQTAIRGPFMRGALLFVGGLFTVMAIAVGSDSIATDVPISGLSPALVGTPVLIGIVLVKFSFDIAGVYRDKLTAFDESTDISFGWAYEPPTETSVDTTLTGEPTSIRPEWRGRLLGGILTLPQQSAAMKIGGMLWLVAGLFALGQAWSIVAAMAILGVAVPVLLSSVDYWLRYGAVEYRTDGDAIVAVDRLFGHALWRIEPWDETVLRVEQDRLDTVFDTYTIVVTLLDDQTIRLPRVATPEPLLAVFDRRADGVAL